MSCLHLKRKEKQQQKLFFFCFIYLQWTDLHLPLYSNSALTGKTLKRVKSFWYLIPHTIDIYLLHKYHYQPTSQKRASIYKKVAKKLFLILVVSIIDQSKEGLMENAPNWDETNATESEADVRNNIYICNTFIY